MKNKSQVKEIKRKIIPILKKHKIKKAGIFGSYARGTAKKNSDIDILVQLGKPMGFEFIGMALELEEKLKKKVDLITYKSISPYLKKYILEDEVRIL